MKLEVWERMIGQMAIRKVKSKKFKTQKEAIAWAKAEKAKISSKPTPKWETNRLESNPNFSWEAVLFREV